MPAEPSRCVALVLPYLKARGTELQALQLVRGLSQRGWRCTLMVTQGWGDPDVVAAFEASGARVMLLPPPLAPGLKRVHRRRVLPLRHALARSGCRVVLSRAGMGNQLAGLAARSLGLPCVAVLSSGVGPPSPAQRSRPWDGLLWRLRLGFPSRIVCVSQQSLQHLQARLPGLRPISMAIVNGVAATAPLPVPAAEPQLRFDPSLLHLCSVGSLECERKGLDLLLEALALVQDRCPRPLLLTLIGTGPDQTRLEDMARQLGLSDQVRFAGEIRGPQRLVAQADLFVLPSRREGLPNALLEAMAVGTCALAADCPTGPAEVIRPGDTGWLVPAGAAEPLADGLVQLLNQPELRRRLGEAGRRSVLADYGSERCADAYDQLLTSLVERA
ncbi:MAG: glycosyltransferase family 4 protein [Cyanobium sp.]